MKINEAREARFLDQLESLATPLDEGALHSVLPLIQASLDGDAASAILNRLTCVLDQRLVDDVAGHLNARYLAGTKIRRDWPALASLTPHFVANEKGEDAWLGIPDERSNQTLVDDMPLLGLVDLRDWVAQVATRSGDGVRAWHLFVVVVDAAFDALVRIGTNDAAAACESMFRQKTSTELWASLLRLRELYATLVDVDDALTDLDRGEEMVLLRRLAELRNERLRRLAGSSRHMNPRWKGRIIDLAGRLDSALPVWREVYEADGRLESLAREQCLEVEAGDQAEDMSGSTVEHDERLAMVAHRLRELGHECLGDLVATKRPLEPFLPIAAAALRGRLIGSRLTACWVAVVMGLLARDEGETARDAATDYKARVFPSGRDRKRQTSTTTPAATEMDDDDRLAATRDPRFWLSKTYPDADV